MKVAYISKDSASAGNIYDVRAKITRIEGRTKGFGPVKRHVTNIQLTLDTQHIAGKFYDRHGKQVEIPSEIAIQIPTNELRNVSTKDSMRIKLVYTAPIWQKQMNVKPFTYRLTSSLLQNR